LSLDISGISIDQAYIKYSSELRDNMAISLGHFLNKKFKYGSQSNRYYLRMFNKIHGNFNANTVHESIIVGKKDKLNGSFLHYSYES
jgi:hypothetical protein